MLVSTVCVAPLAYIAYFGHLNHTTSRGVLLCLLTVLIRLQCK